MRCLLSRLLKRVIIIMVCVVTFRLCSVMFYTDLTRMSDEPVRYLKDLRKLPNGSIAQRPLELNKCTKLTKVREDKDLLLSTIIPQDSDWEWFHNRVDKTWNIWLHTLHGLNVTGSMEGKVKKHILINPGVLTATTFSQSSTTKSGGPLGDLVQWCDLIMALYFLGHSIILEKDVHKIGRRLMQDDLSWRREHAECEDDTVDIVYADIHAVKAYPAQAVEKYKHLLRVIDVYGTDAMYNNPELAAKYNYNSPYGKLNLNLKQFHTFYPHDDNTFLGFAVTPAMTPSQTKENIGVLYGKESRYFKHNSKYIELLMSHIEAHSTTKEVIRSPKGIINHGILTAAEYRALLSKAKYFIGFQHPIEGTGVMEALANGCIFLNPMFKGQDALLFRKGDKPTTRKVTSQVPYLEEYIGPPHVYTIDMTNETHITEILSTTENVKVTNFIPKDFTVEAFIQRVSILTQQQNFTASAVLAKCSIMSDIKVVTSEPGDSCSQACRKLKPPSACEPACFVNLNDINAFNRSGIQCKSFQREKHVVFPGVYEDTNTCILQDDHMLFSCAGSIEDFRRLCPCRLKV